MAKVKQNKPKTKLDQLINLLPNRYGYADKVVERLKKKGILVTPSVVYQVVHGSIHQQAVTMELISLVKEYKKKQAKIDKELEEALKSE